MFVGTLSLKHSIAIASALLWLFCTPLLNAQSSIPDSPGAPAAARSTNLDSLYSTIELKQSQLQTLQNQIKRSGVDPTPAQQQDIDQLSADSDSLLKTFAQLATGGIEIVEVGTEHEEFDWRKEIILVTQPLLENLKGLTEKPRKIERLKTIISQRQEEATEINNALSNLTINLDIYQSGPTSTALARLKTVWQRRQNDNVQSLELSRYQLATLQGDNTPRIETVKSVLFEFLSGRGLTLGLVFLVSLTLWLFTRGLLWVILRNRKRETSRSQLVSHRLASYGYSFFTTILIIIGVMVVLYVRGDLLLLALAIVVFASIALSLRTILPRFVVEARLLLNIGAIREGERVMYQGLPFEVKSINVHSFLRNPHLSGVIRLPLSSLKDMTSRPNFDENWFPSQTGDVLLMSDGTLEEVVSQTPEFVELRNRTGTLSYLPTTDFISLKFENLTRSGSYMVVTYFGVDYELQDISLTVIPVMFQQQIAAKLADTEHDQHVMDVRVDFHTASASSLDYILFVQLHSDAAMAKYKIERIIQQTCIQVCNKHNWTIPFPQLTVHRAGASKGTDADTTNDDYAMKVVGG